MPDENMKALNIPDGVHLPSSPEELAQALFNSADFRLAEELDDEPYAASWAEELEGNEREA